MKRFAWTVFSLGVCFVSTSSWAQSSRLVGWWKMDEPSGATTLADSSGYGRHAAAGEGVSIVDGRFGKAARFNGTTNAWARFTANTALSNFTFSVWFNVPASYTNNQLPKLIQFNALYYQLTFSAPGQFNLGIGTVPNRAEWTSLNAEPFKFTTNRWFHGALVVRRVYTNATDWVAQPAFYLNGVRYGGDVQTAKTYAPGVFDAGYVCMGNTSPGGPRALDGALDDVRIFNEALTDHEIFALYQNCPCMVDAGAGQTVHRESARLQGRLASTNAFSRAIAATSLWSVVSAPEGAAPVIAFPDLPETAVTLPQAGTYVFRLTAFSELGNGSSEVTFNRAAGEAQGNAAPTVTPLWAATNVVLGTAAPLAAAVADDGAPGATRVRWSKLSGPGGVFFDNAFTNATAATFATNGVYTLQLEADDGAATGAAVITVTVSLPAGDLASGLAHWWRMDDDPALNRAADGAGTNTLSFGRYAFLQPGKTGYGFRAPLTNAYAQGAHALTNAETLTFTAWLYHDEAYVKRAANNLFQRVYNCGPNFWLLYDLQSKIFSLSTTGIGTSSTNHLWTWNAPLASNQWNHITVLFDRRPAASGSRQVMYLNGVKLLSGPYNTAFPGAVDFAAPFLVGNNTAVVSGSRNFDGVLDEMRVYSRFVTDEESRLLAADPDNNHAPVIEAPATALAKVAQPAAALAAVYDDAQPQGKSLATRWSVVSGDPSKVQFENAGEPGAAVTFTKAGEYVLRLDASDGELRSAASIRVSVKPTGSMMSVH